MNHPYPIDLLGSVTLHSGKPTTTSLDVAEVFGKRHDHVLRDIQSINGSKSGSVEAVNGPKFGGVEKFFLANFELASYMDAKGEKRRMYHLTKDGFTLLVMGYTGEKAMLFKIAYIAEFNRMQAKLESIKTTALFRAHRKLEERNPDWKVIRREYLDAAGTAARIEQRHGYGRGKVSRNVRRMVEWGYMSEKDVKSYKRLHREFSAVLKSAQARQEGGAK